MLVYGLFLAVSILAFLLYRRVQELSHSRANLRLTLESSSDIVFVMDKKARYVSVFCSDESILARRRDEIIGKHVIDVLGPELGGTTVQLLADVFATGEAKVLDYTLINSDGKRGWYRGTVAKRTGDTAVITVRDITGIKDVESKAKHMQERLSYALEKAGVGVWEWNATTQQISWDESMHRLYGSRPNDGTILSADSWTNFLHPDDREATLAEACRGWIEDGRIDLRFRIIQANGTIQHLRSVGEISEADDGTATRMVGVAWSISREAALVEDFEQQKRFTEEILNAIADPVFMKDEGHRWTYGNRAFSRLLGFEPAAYIGKTDHDIFPKEVADKFWESDERAFNEATDFELEETILYPDGTSGTVLTKKSPFAAIDGSKTLVGVIRDITDRKQMQQQLEEQRARQVAASRLASLGEMAGGVAHEINNPLAIISGYASRLLDVLETLKKANLTDDEKKANDRGIEIVKRVESTTSRIASIVKGLRAIARDGSSDPKTPVDIAQIVEETLPLCMEHFRNKGVTIDSNIETGLVVECRRVQISQVLLNLLTNAYYAVSTMREGGFINLTAKRIGDQVEFAVEDSGPGIEPEARDRIFEPFYTTKPVGMGTGLGLSIAVSLVRDHHGDIYLDSESSRTRFVVRLPLVEGSQAVM